MPFFSERVVAKVLDKIVSGIAVLEEPVTPDIQPTVTDLANWDFFKGNLPRYGSVSNARKPEDNVTFLVSPGNVGDVNIAFKTTTEKLLSIEVGCHGAPMMNFVWATDERYDALRTIKRPIDERTIEARHLTNHELETLRAVTDLTMTSYGLPARLFYRARVTLDQMQYLLSLMYPDASAGRIYEISKGIPKTQPYALGMLSIPCTDRERRSIADDFRKYVSPYITDGGKRILDIFDTLEMYRPDLQAIRDARHAAHSDYSAQITQKGGYVICCECEGREEGFRGGWALKYYPDEAWANVALNEANILLAAFTESTDPEVIKNAGMELYAMFPRLHQDRMLSEYTRFTVEAIS